MSANFWNSTQRQKWQFNRQSLLDQRRRLLILERKMIQNGFIKDYPNINYDANMRIYLHNLIIKLGRRLNIRQVALATAQVYLTRFLLKVSLKEINVYLMVTTCIYVGCKIEESPQHIRLIISEARNLWPEYIPSDITKLAEFEFYLIEEMDLYLFVHHPYKSLLQIKQFLQDNVHQYQFQLTNDELQHSWSLINDSYITDLHLLYPPHILALSAIYITVVLKKSLNAIRSNNVGDHDSKDMHIDDLMVLKGDNSSNTNPSRHSKSNSITSIHDGNNIKPKHKQKHNDHDNDQDIKHSTSSSNQGPGPGQHHHGSTVTTKLHGTNGHNTKQLNTNLQDLKLDEDTIKINRFMQFIGESHVNLEQIIESVQDLINLYVIWNRYNENHIKKALQYMLLNR